MTSLALGRVCMRRTRVVGGACRHFEMERESSANACVHVQAHQSTALLLIFTHALCGASGPVYSTVSCLLCFRLDEVFN